MSLCRLAALFGMTRQGYWKGTRASQSSALDESALIGEVRSIRTEMPMLGCRKLQAVLSARGHRIGRDRLFSLLRSSGMLVTRRRYRAVTTDSRHWMRKWPNLIREFTPVCYNQLWVSDITYVETWRGDERSWRYLSLITDAYTHEIVGHALHDSLDTEGPLRALMMALEKFPDGSVKGLIHHSDRGCQYCSAEYVGTLQDHGVRISMTENGDPYENAVAERVNGIIKREWLYHIRLETDGAKKKIDEIIYTYNNMRPHMSVGYLTPVEARRMKGRQDRRWRNYYRDRTEAAAKAAAN